MKFQAAPPPRLLADFPKSLLYAFLLGAASLFLPWGSMMLNDKEEWHGLLTPQQSATFGFPGSMEMNITISPLSGGHVNLQGLILPLWFLSLATLVAPTLLLLRWALQAATAAAATAAQTDTNNGPAPAATADTSGAPAPPAATTLPTGAKRRQPPTETSPLYTPRLLIWRIALPMLLLISLLVIWVQGSPQLGLLFALASSTLSLFPGRHPVPLP